MLSTCTAYVFRSASLGCSSCATGRPSSQTYSLTVRHGLAGTPVRSYSPIVSPPGRNEKYVFFPVAPSVLATRRFIALNSNRATTDVTAASVRHASTSGPPEPGAAFPTSTSLPSASCTMQTVCVMLVPAGS